MKAPGISADIAIQLLVLGKFPNSLLRTSSILQCARTIHLCWKILRLLKSVSSRNLASSILLAISALFFHREPSAGTHGVFVFVSSETKCWNLRYYCLCFHIGDQVLELTALLSLLSSLVPGHLARGSARYQ